MSKVELLDGRCSNSVQRNLGSSVTGSWSSSGRLGIARSNEIQRLGSRTT
jgi:hypothetical protein